MANATASDSRIEALKALVLPWPAAARTLVLAYVVYWFGLVIYRLYFHPLAGFPGPRLAAATSWWEFYYDVVKDGELVFQLPRLHEKYGPVVRLSPRELHIDDLEFYSEIYKQNTRFHKDSHFYDTLGFPTASVCITDPAQHRSRREILNPFFSKRTIATLSSVLHTTIEKLCTNIALRAESHGAVPLQDAFHCMTVDIISGYAFGTSFNMLDAPDFNAVHVRSVERSAETQWLIKHVPAIRWIADRLPGPLGTWLDGGLMQLSGTCETIVKDLLASDDRANPADTNKHTTVFDALLNPTGSSKGHIVPSYQELVDEAIILLAAGTETTAIALTFATYHILANPPVLAAIQHELAHVPRDPDGRLPYQALENLPYLTAVIKETLRLTHAVPGKLPRIVPRGGAAVPSAPAAPRIPAGTCVAVSHYSVHMNAGLFPQPHEFRPDRWLEPGERARERWIVSFSKGSRACLGINLAYAEMYMTLAYLFARFELRLFETGEREMKWKDHGVAHTVGHLKVTVKERERERVGVSGCE